MVRQGMQGQVERGAGNERRRQTATRDGYDGVEPHAAPARHMLGHHLLHAGVVVRKSGAWGGHGIEAWTGRGNFATWRAARVLGIAGVWLPPGCQTPYC